MNWSSVANLGLILTNRSWSHTILGILKRPNAALRWVVMGAIVGLAFILYVPFLNNLFRFDALHLDDLLICLNAGVVSVLGFEALKLLLPHIEKPTAKLAARSAS